MRRQSMNSRVLAGLFEHPKQRVLAGFTISGFTVVDAGRLGNSSKLP